MAQWYEETIKRQLPDVMVNDYGDVGYAQLSGRDNEFATLTLPTGKRVEVAWATLASALTYGRAIII